MKIFLMSFVLTIVAMLSTAYAISWDNINTIYYNAAEDDATNRFLQQAANELKTNLENVSLKTFTIDNTTKPSVGIFLINDSLHPQLVGKNDEAFWLYTNDSGIYIIGKTPIAVRHGAYTLLEKLGYRWFFKSEAWNVKPDSLVSLDSLNEVKEPFFIYRRIFQGGERGVDRAKWQAWQRWNRLGGAQQYNPGETYQYIISRTDTTAPPEVFCPGGSPTWPNNKQLRPDHPYVLEKSIEFARRSLNVTAVLNRVIFPDSLPPGSAYVSPNDGGGWCPEYNDDKQVITDKVFGLANEVAKAVAADFPGKYIGILSYSTYDILPTIPLQPNLLVMVTTRPVLDYPVQSRLEGFAAKGVMTGIYAYYDVSVWDQDRPPMSERFNEFHELLRSIPLYADRGAKQFIAESSDNWGAKGLLYYAASQLFWDPYTDLNAILDDFYTKAFGPAKAPMKRYYEWLNSDPVYRSERSIAYALNQLNEAETLAKDNPAVLERIRHAQYYVQYLWRRNIYKSGDDLQDTKDFYKYIHRIRDTYVLYHYYREAALATTLRNASVSDAEITSLQITTLPTPEEARGWMDTMLASFAGKDLMYAPYIDVSNMTLVPLGEDGVVKLPAMDVRGRNALVYATAGSTVTMTGSYKTLYWKDPAGNELDIRTGSPPGTTVSGTFEFKAPKTGVYRLYLWGSISNISAPAAYLVGTPDGGVVRWFEGTPQAYFYVPSNTPVLVFGVRRVYSNPTPTANVYALAGNQTIGGQCDSTCEWSIANPAPGLWKLDANIGWGTTLWLLGVPPLLWNDPQYLLVPANTVLKLILGQYRQAIKPVVDGSNITIEIPIIFYDKSSTAFTVSKPLWNNTINFRFNESGSITSINTTYITFTVDPNKSVSLLFDIPPPRKTNDIIPIQNSTFYRKEITISSNNSLTNVTATIDINTDYANYKLYELQGSTWIDVTSNYNLTISNNKATFSGFSTSEKQFRIEGVQPIEQPPEQPSQPPAQPQPTPSGGGGGPVTSISTPITSPITKEPETIKPTEVKQETGAVSLELTAPDTVESGDIYNATVKLLSPIKKTYTLTISNIKQNVELEAGKEKLLTIPIRAMEARGSFSLTSSIDGTTKSKIINLDYKPLFLYVNESKAGNETLITVTVKNYQPLSTELRIIKDGKSDVFIELIEGQKEYQRQLKLTQPGEYKIIATASSEGKTIDTDEYLLAIAGEKQFDYRLWFIVVFAVITILIVLMRLIR